MTTMVTTTATTAMMMIIEKHYEGDVEFIIGQCIYT